MGFNSLPISRLVARLRATARADESSTAPSGAVPAAHAAPGSDSAPDVAVDLAPLHPALRLSDIRLREVVELVSIDLPSDELEPLLELGVMPGCTLCPVRNSPFGDPVLMVDGSLIAVRREMARCLCVRRGGLASN